MKLERLVHAAPLAIVLGLLAPLAGCRSTTNDAQHGSMKVDAKNPQQQTATYQAVIKDLDKRIAFMAKRIENRPGDWLTRAHLASMLLERAGLSNSYDDFAQTEEVLSDAFANAPNGSGPLLLAARFNYTIHRLDAAERFLDKMNERKLQQQDEVIAGHALRAQIAFQRGQYGKAIAGLRAVAAVAPKAVLTDLALYHAKTGNVAEAEKLYEQAFTAAKSSDPRGRAWVRLQQGLIAMNHGRYDEALTRLQAAQAELPGWWLVDEHVAEVHVALGNDAQAATIYEDIVERTKNPQFIDALAGCYRRMDRADEADELVAEARDGWDALIKQYPEAAGGHGLEHYLQNGTADEALALAKANYETRPGAEAQLMLASAYLKAEKPELALAMTQKVLATPFRSASVHDMARQAYHALNQYEAAEEQQQLCLAINPRSCVSEDFPHVH